MSFHRQSFKTRFGTMGDPAEAVFDLVYPKNHKLGLNRPPFYMGGMVLAMRYVPDRMLRDRFVEVMGCGRDGKLKLKHEKIEALQTWQQIGPVELFVYDQFNETYYEAPLDAWVSAAHTLGASRTFDNDGKTYLELHISDFPTNQHPVPRGNPD